MERGAENDVSFVISETAQIAGKVEFGKPSGCDYETGRRGFVLAEARLSSRNRLWRSRPTVRAVSGLQTRRQAIVNNPRRDGLRRKDGGVRAGRSNESFRLLLEIQTARQRRRQSSLKASANPEKI